MFTNFSSNFDQLRLRSWYQYNINATLGQFFRVFFANAIGRSSHNCKRKRIFCLLLTIFNYYNELQICNKKKPKKEEIFVSLFSQVINVRQRLQFFIQNGKDSKIRWKRLSSRQTWILLCVRWWRYSNCVISFQDSHYRDADKIESQR